MTSPVVASVRLPLWTRDVPVKRCCSDLLDMSDSPRKWRVHAEAERTRGIRVGCVEQLSCEDRVEQGWRVRLMLRDSCERSHDGHDGQGQDLEEGEVSHLGGLCGMRGRRGALLALATHVY